MIFHVPVGVFQGRVPGTEIKPTEPDAVRTAVGNPEEFRPFCFFFPFLRQYYFSKKV